MKKIGILHCIRANEVCTGAGCFNAFTNKTDYFRVYKNEEITLSAFFSCNGCSKERPQSPKEDAGILEKLDRLVDEKIGTVHVGVCCNMKAEHECPRISEIITMLQMRGINVIYGTHGNK